MRGGPLHGLCSNVIQSRTHLPYIIPPPNFFILFLELTSDRNLFHCFPQCPPPKLHLPPSWVPNGCTMSAWMTLESEVKVRFRPSYSDHQRFPSLFPQLIEGKSDFSSRQHLAPQKETFLFLNTNNTKL